MNGMNAGAVACAVVLSLQGTGHAAPAYDLDSLRGRYAGHINVVENFSDGTSTFHVEARQLLALTFDAKGGVVGTSAVTVAVPGQPPFTCPFSVAGTYEMGSEGLGTGSIDLASPVEACSDGVTLKLNLLLSGSKRERVEVTIDRAVSSKDGDLPLLGSGTLEK